MMIDNYVLFWFIFVVIFLLIEVITVNLVTLWFAIGSIFSLVTAIYVSNFNIQIAVFLSVSVILLVLLRPIYTKYIKTKNIKTNAQSLIGEVGKVISEVIDKDTVGLVKIKSQIWSAISDTDETIYIKEKIKVLRIEGVKLIVKKID